MNAEAEDEYLRMVAGGDILPVGADFPESHQDTYDRGVRDRKVELARRLLKMRTEPGGTSVQERIAAALERIEAHLCSPEKQ